MVFDPTAEEPRSPVPGVIPEPVRVHRDLPPGSSLADDADEGRAATEALRDADRRWVNEGGSSDSDDEADPSGAS